MTQWKAVFRSKRREPQHERWACTGCGAVVDQSHHETPKDGICSCGMDHSKEISNAYREGYDKVDWSQGQGPGRWSETGKAGIRRFIPAGTIRCERCGIIISEMQETFFKEKVPLCARCIPDLKIQVIDPY